MNIRLRAARKAARKTQRQVAEEAKSSIRLYQDYEYGKREPGVYAAIRIARVVGVSVEDLFEEAAFQRSQAKM